MIKLVHLLSLMGAIISFASAADFKKQALVVIMAPTPVIHEVSVFAKQHSEPPEKTTMTAAANAEDDCMQMYRDPVTGKCPYHDHLHVADISFERPTTEPRPITVNFKDYTIQCTFALNQAMDGRVVAWNIHKDWGLDGRKSDFQITCDNATAFYGEPYGTPESEMPTTSVV